MGRRRQQTETKRVDGERFLKRCGVSTRTSPAGMVWWEVGGDGICFGLRRLNGGFPHEIGPGEGEGGGRSERGTDGLRPRMV